MKLFTKELRGNITLFKFLGVVYCWKVNNKHKSHYKKSYFNGLIKTDRIFKTYKYEIFHDIYILNTKVIKKNEDGEFIYYYLFNKLIKKVSIEDYLKNRFFNCINDNYDFAYILNANSGEIYLFLTYLLDALIKKDGAKKPILIATKKYHVDMVKMIAPEIPYIFTNRFYTNIKKEKFSIKNTKFLAVFTNQHFINVEKAIINNPINSTHYFEEMINTLSLQSNSIKQRQIKLLPNSGKTMLNKVKNIGLNLDNFILISPEANSCNPVSQTFWTNIIRKKQKEGYDIFINVALDKFTIDHNCKSCFLTYAEAFALALRAKKIYSLRSGFTEFLLQTKVPMEVYYTNFGVKLTAEKVKSGFSMNKIPYTNKELIKEVIINE